MTSPVYPDAVDAEKVGSYPVVTSSGGGHFYDDVLEYRVRCYPERGAPDEEDGDDYFYAFKSYDEALAFASATPGTEPPCVLVRQLEHINEPTQNVYIHSKSERLTEWLPEWLANSKRTPSSIPEFLAGKERFTKER